MIGSGLSRVLTLDMDGAWIDDTLIVVQTLFFSRCGLPSSRPLRWPIGFFFFHKCNFVSLAFFFSFSGLNLPLYQSINLLDINYPLLLFFFLVQVIYLPFVQQIFLNLLFSCLYLPYLFLCFRVFASILQQSLPRIGLLSLNIKNCTRTHTPTHFHLYVSFIRNNTHSYTSTPTHIIIVFCLISFSSSLSLLWDFFVVNFFLPQPYPQVHGPLVGPLWQSFEQ